MLVAFWPGAAESQGPARYAEVFSEKLKLQRDLRDRLTETLTPLAHPYEIFVSVSVEAEAEVRKMVDRQTQPGMQVDLGSGESFKLPGLPTVKGSKLKGSPKVNISVPSRESVSTREKIQARVERVHVEVRHHPGISEDRLGQMREVALGVASLDLSAGDTLDFAVLARQGPEEVQMLFAPDLLPVVIISLTVLLSTLMLAIAIGRRKTHTTEVGGGSTSVRAGAGGSPEEVLEPSGEEDLEAELAGSLLGQVRGQHFAFLAELDAPSQTELLSRLRPEVAAVVLDRFGVEGAVLRGFFGRMEESQKIALVRAIAQTRSLETDRLEAMEAEVRTSAEEIQSRVSIGSPVIATELLALAGSGDTRAILEALGKDDPELARQLRGGLVLFEDLPEVPAASIRTAVTELSPTTVALALRGAEGPVREALLGAVSKRLRTILESEEKYLGEAEPQKVEEARQAFERKLRVAAARPRSASSRPTEQT